LIILCGGFAVLQAPGLALSHKPTAPRTTDGTGLHLASGQVSSWSVYSMGVLIDDDFSLQGQGDELHVHANHQIRSAYLWSSPGLMDTL
jgi:hypothetical protein